MAPVPTLIAATATGVALFVVVPLPSWPRPLFPQQYTAPPVVTPQVWSPPPLTVAKVRTDTVIAAVPLCPSLVAVIVAWPAATPVASPVKFTVATAGLLVAQVTITATDRQSTRL